jgi:hypothetical protein
MSTNKKGVPKDPYDVAEQNPTGILDATSAIPSCKKALLPLTSFNVKRQMVG